MDHFAGLDVSVKETSICVVDDTGKIVGEAKVASEPDALLQVLKNSAYHFKRIGLEAGPLSHKAAEQERREALNEIERLERPKWLKSEREAKLLVAAWNVRVRATLIARRFYLGCLCPGCGQRGSVDLRRINRHPDASLENQCRG
jgi:hypothetical protein